jgi:hypothetical protein
VTPDIASLPLNETPRAWLYQPFTSGARPAVAVTTGFVPSYWSGKPTDVRFPASSEHEPPSDAVAESGAEYVTGVSQVTPPETASMPENETVSAWLYQPFASGPRDGVAVTEGPSSSNWNVDATGPLVFPALSLHVPLTEAPPLSGPE